MPASQGLLTLFKGTLGYEGIVRRGRQGLRRGTGSAVTVVLSSVCLVVSEKT